MEQRLAELERGQGTLSEPARSEARALMAELRAAGGGDELARAALVIASRWPQSEASERVELLREGLAHAGSRARLDQLRLQLADIHSLSGDFSEAARNLDEVAPERLSATGANTFALQLRRLGRYDEAEAAWLALLARRDLSDRLRCLAWSYVAHLRLTTGRLDAAELALAAADAVDDPGDDVRLHVATTRFDLALRQRDIDAARAALEGAPVARDPAHAELMQANRTCLNALTGVWDAEAFRRLLGDARADLRLLGATGLLGAAASTGDTGAAQQALLAAERAHAASPVVGPELAWMAEVAASACEERAFPRRDVARARRWAAQAYHEVDPARAAEQRERLAALRVPLAGPFQLQVALGRGGGGTVFRALHVSGIAAAVKVLHDPNPKTRDLLENELRAVATLEHPCIASLFDTGIVDEAEAATHADLSAGTRWIASELVGGGELTSLCGQIPWERSLSLILGVLDALAHAHARDLLHLDIKPGNILLHPSGAPVVVDFGLARGVGTGRPELLSGTPEYMAPELFQRGWTHVGPATDVFAAACTLHQLVTGQSPFQGTLREVREQHRRGELPPLRAPMPVPEDLEAWLKTALAPDPADRFPTAASAAQALVDLGPARGRGAPVPLLRSSEAPTVVLDTVLTAPSGTGRRGAGMAAPEPRIPAMWTRTERRDRPELAAASLGLFQHRRPPLVGRRSERSVLWASLLQAERGERVVVAVTGPEGSGRRALVRWLIERAREVGAGRVGLAHLHAPPLATVEAEPGRLVLVTAAEWPEDWPDAVEVALGPLDDATLREILDRMLHLAGDLAAAIVGRCAGLPGRAVALLSELVALDRLVDGPDGYQLRRGATFGSARR